MTTNMVFKVVPYDASDEQALLEASTKWQHLFGNGLAVSDNEILVQGMFKHQQDGRQEFRTYEALAAKALGYEMPFRDQFELNENGVYSRSPPSDTQKDITERLGVAVEILTVNRVAGLTARRTRRSTSR